MSARAAALLRRVAVLLLCLLLVFSLSACTSDEISSAISVAGDIVSALTDGDSSEESRAESTDHDAEDWLDPNGSYDDRDSVALYLVQYGCLPLNYMTKSEAHKLGWDGGSLEQYAPGMCIGGDSFGNYEKLLPTDRSYRECDINTLGASKRGAERIIYSDDLSLIYYTDDHYASFTLLYGEE